MQRTEKRHRRILSDGLHPIGASPHAVGARAVDELPAGCQEVSGEAQFHRGDERDAGAFVGFLIGCYAGFRALWRVTKTMQRDIEIEERMQRGEDPWSKDEKKETDGTA